MEIELLYRDEWLCVVHKPAGWLVHPAEVPAAEDVVAMKVLRDQLGTLVYSIHRLDRPTCGVLLFGIDREVAHRLHVALEQQGMEKVYWALVRGRPGLEEWVCEEPIQKAEGKPWREARTVFRSLCTWSPEGLDGELVSLVEARPLTGRYHQIRRHLVGAGLPIVGDYRYGGIAACDWHGERLGTGSRMLLQARSLAFDHPVSGERVVVESAWEWPGLMGSGVKARE